MSKKQCSDTSGILDSRTVIINDGIHNRIAHLLREVNKRYNRKLVIELKSYQFLYREAFNEEYSKFLKKQELRELERVKNEQFRKELLQDS